MTYYDSHSKQLLTETTVRNRGLDSTNILLLETAGIWVVSDASQDPIPEEGEEPKVYDPRFYNYKATDFVATDELRSAVQFFRHEELTIPELQASLKKLQEDKPGFHKAFTTLDYHRARPASAVAEAIALALPPDAADTDILGQLNMIAEDNRQIMAGLASLGIPEDATFAEACEILELAYDCVPWLPQSLEEPSEGGI